MAYMKVLSRTETQLLLLREPTFLSKAVFVGMLVGVFGVFFYGTESCLLKMVIGLCMLFLSSVLIDKYEFCKIDKDLAVIELSKLHYCQYLLQGFGLFSSHPYVTFNIENVQDVCVQDQLGAPAGKASQVVFVLDSGLKMSATEVFTCLSNNEETATVIRSFLNISDSISQNEHEYEGDGSSSSDDDVEMEGFEQISSADLKDLEVELSKASQGSEAIGDALRNTNDASAAAAACAVDEHGDNAYQGLGENAASS